MYEPGWAWQPEKCPCDRDFIEWFGDRKGLTVFHMGTGLHHKVGLELSEYNDVIGLTLAPEELMEYTRLVEKDRWLQSAYTVLFGDITTFNRRLLPELDIVTLFHLGEIVPNPVEFSVTFIIGTFEHRLAKNGKILAYTGSSAAPQVLPYFDQQLDFDSEFKSLRIYKKRP